MNYIEQFRVRYKDKDGKFISEAEWAGLLENRDYCIIKKTFINRKEISTIWLGLIHIGGYYFETMVFTYGDCEDLEMERYASLQDAIDGHERFVKEYMKLEKKE